uniref:Carboxylic ester hydrolase n=1 Tax=Myripristis murdjan TaxID=586833 RepID=A0A667ZYD9_9TELE
MATASHFKHITILLHSLLLHFLTASLATQDDLVINTENGRVRGTLLSGVGGDVRAFLGIPYGQPPLGKLRFRAPVPVETWHGVKDVTKLPDACYQLLDTKFPGFSGSEMWNPKTPLSEDCLYLNVWSPRLNRTQPQASGLAVLVWIYGGGFSTGTSTLDIYNGFFLSRSEGVVVVSMNYRLGAFGFLSLPDSNSIRGNAGLLDQQLALQWVANNIAGFGGDPSKVTLFGESAGGASVGFHLLSPRSHALFNRAVMQSGSPNAPWATVSKKEAWNRYCASMYKCKLGCPLSPPADLEACLQKADPQHIVIKQYEVLTQPSLLLLPFLPHVDNNFLLQEPEVLLQNGDFKKTEVMLGLNKDEGTFFVVYGVPGYDITSESLITRNNFLQGVAMTMSEASNVTREASIFHYTDWTDVNNGRKNRDTLGFLVGDQLFNCPVLEFAQSAEPKQLNTINFCCRYSQHGGKTHFYMFDHRSTKNSWPEWMGVMHGDEIEFVFGLPLNATLGYSQKDVNVTRKLMRHWANFAKTGNPSIGGVDWPKFTPEGQEYVTLNSNPPETKRMLKAQECRLWNSLTPKIQQVSG